MTDILPPAGWPSVRQLETNEFATGGANGNMNEQAKSLAARSELLKRYAALPYGGKTGGYALNESVQLATGDIVRSTIASNVNNPNVNMTGWVSTAAWSSIKNKPTTVAGYGITDAYTKTEVDTAIANASTSTSGTVQLNNTLTSSSTSQALTAAQGKVLKDSKIETTARAAANGVASLDANTKVPVSQLPAATISDAGVLCFATATEVENKANVMAAVTPANVAAMIEQSPNATGTVADATETVAGKAKIATTAISQAGTNDTDIITAKKLRNALNANGNAPISACRAWVNFSANGGVITVNGSLNIASVTRVSAGIYTVNFNAPMPIQNYAVFVSNSGNLQNNSRINATSDTSFPTIKTANSVQVAVSGAQSFGDTANMSVGVFC